MSKAVQHLQSISVHDEYGTPTDKFENACKKYDVYPHIDVCSNAANAKCTEFITKEQDALKQQWDLDYFMNPPYSKAYEFMEYAYNQHLKHNVSGLCLTFSKTDTAWWHEFVEDKAEVHFIRGRINFNDEFGNPKMIWEKKRQKFVKGVSPYPSCWIIYRKNKVA